MARKVIMKVLPKNIPDLEEPCPICLLNTETKVPKGLTIDVAKFSPPFMLQMYLYFSMLKTSMYLSWLLWLYVLLHSTHLGVYKKANERLLVSSNALSLNWWIMIIKWHSTKWMKMYHWQDILDLWRHVIAWKSQLKLNVYMNLHSMVDLKSQMILWPISKKLFYWTQVTINNFVTLNISMTYGSPSELVIGYVVMFLTLSGMYQYHDIDTSKYGVQESASSMGMSQK